MTSLDLLYTWKSLCYHFDRILGDESDSHLKAKHIILLKFNFFLYATLENMVLILNGALLRKQWFQIAFFFCAEKFRSKFSYYTSLVDGR